MNRLETWAGPGQVEVLSTGFGRLNAEIAAIRKVQDRHTAQLNRLTTDVAELRKGMREILRRLPEESSAS